MMRFSVSPLLLAAAALTLSACDSSKPTGGGNVTMRDMEVVDGTANDSMTDLDNATQDGTLLSNAGGLPGAVPMGSGGAASNSATPGNAVEAAATAGSKEKNGNTSAPE